MAEISKERLLWMYERMRLIRGCEDTLVDLFTSGRRSGFVHLSSGMEAIAAGVMVHLTVRDWITSPHRCHGHCVAKGVDIKAIMAELDGRATGSCKGKGGSCHISDIKQGMLGAFGIVGAGGPLACGSGLSAKVLGTDQVTVCFFGDGAFEQGTMHESMNLASIWKLPVVFVCENNLYAESTPCSYHCAAKNLSDRAIAYDMPGVEVDGTDIFAVYEAAGEAIARARRGEGPSLIEARAFTYHGHYFGDSQTYKSKEELAGYPARDPIETFKKRLLERGLLSEAELAEIDTRANEVLKEAVLFAEESPYPALEECLTDVYMSYQ